MIDAFVFDFDGLIVDTETPIVEAWVKIHERAGIVCSRNHALSVVGHADMDFDPWIAFGPEVDRLELEKNHYELRHQLISAQPILPGVESLLTEARAAGIRLGVASNSTHAWVDHHLQRIGLLNTFDVVRCRDDVSRGKPEPEIYLSALAALGADPARSVAFEDSLPGSEAAHRAGLFCVVAPNPSTQHHQFPHAHWRVDSLAEVTLAALIARMRT
jgi:haloacid dehalogenase superfamily, subfamily IA, variant 3 with third motif having DD or ED/haloacid dehalogenase superfamily, subfamily IA, variant 1 with third motif having Dx(3-4)D or Dx(3-4)E